MALRIEDVPCPSCVNGYGRKHRCDVPEYCPCDQTEQHPGEKTVNPMDEPADAGINTEAVNDR